MPQWWVRGHMHGCSTTPTRGVTVPRRSRREGVLLRDTDVSYLGLRRCVRPGRGDVCDDPTLKHGDSSDHLKDDTPIIRLEVSLILVEPTLRCTS